MLTAARGEREHVRHRLQVARLHLKHSVRNVAESHIVQIIYAKLDRPAALVQPALRSPDLRDHLLVLPLPRQLRVLQIKMDPAASADDCSIAWTM